MIFIKGKVIRKIKGFYYILNEDSNDLNNENIYECRLRGTLKVKNNKLNCIIGDIVEFDEKEKVINKIFERENYLERPLISNIDYIGILFSIVNPKFDLINFQKMFLNSIEQEIPSILILSKIDLISQEELNLFIIEFNKIFKEKMPLFCISNEKNDGIEDLKRYIDNKTIIISGPSGVGKSTLINNIVGKKILETNEISLKTSRGKHTTTESRFFKIKDGTYIVDTPGFSSLEFPKIENKKDVEKLFPEFIEYVSECKFRDCLHLNEPNCNIKNKVENKEISEERYKFYLYTLNNIFKN